MNDEQMTEQEAKTIINSYGYPNIRKHLAAIHVALEVLGDDATMTEIWAWAEDKEKEQ